MDGVWREAKQAARRAGKEPGFTAVTVLTLGLALGSSAAMLGVVKATFMSRLPIPQSERVLRIYASLRKADGTVSTVTVRGAEFNVLAQATAGERGPFAALVGLEDVPATLQGQETPQRVTLIYCTPGWMQALRTAPAAGRWPGAEEEARGDASGVAVVAKELAARRFGGDAGAVGRTITLDGRVYSIVGVMPAGFRFPYDAEVWTPGTTPWDMTRDYAVFARLKDGVTRERAQAALDAAGKAVQTQFPEETPGFGFSQTTILENLLDNRQRAGAALAGVAAFFLLLACVNVANLLLARAVAREREQAIRRALGASRWQTFRGTMGEAVWLAAAGTCAGLVLAAWLGGRLDLLVPPNLTQQLGILPDTADWRVVLATAGIGLAAGVLAGLLPALRGARAEAEGLLQGSHRAGRSKRERRVMDGFVAAQFMLALALLAGAGFMLRNFAQLAHRDLGIDSSRLLSMQVSVPGARYASAAAKRALVRNIVREAATAGGVASAGVTTLNPLDEATWWAPVAVQGHETAPGASALVNHRLVTPDLLRTMGIPLLAGRCFGEQDDENAPPVVVVSAGMAKRFFPGEDAVGKRVRLDRAGQPWLTVVGVVGDVQDWHNPRDPKETWYLPYAQWAGTPAASGVFLMVRSEGDPRSVQGAVEKAVWRVDADLAVFDQSTMDGVYRKSLAQQRLGVALMAALAGFGLLLGALGIYGTVSLAAGERVREIGIRMALGSTPGAVLRMLLAEGLRVSLVGVAAGMGAAWAMGRVLASQFAEVQPADPAVMAEAASVLLLTAFLAISIPARRAAHVVPLAALKHE